MTVLQGVIDAAGALTGVLAAWFWFLSGRRRLRRVSKYEELDYQDLNRIVVAINRANTLNRRAALAAAASALCVALGFVARFIGRM